MSARRAAAILAVMLPACSLDPGPSTLTSAEPVELRSPMAGAVIAQNDADAGCTAHSTRGYGYAITFEWRAAPREARATYRLEFGRAGAEPVIVVEGPGTRHVHQACNTFVSDRNLEGWEWRVRWTGQGADGPITSDWAARTFVFAPCRVQQGAACSAT